MDKYSYNLEYLSNDYGLYLKIIELLDNDMNWKRVVSAFQNNKIPIIFNEREIKKMEKSTSPAEYLLSELQSRFCRVGNLCDILRQCNLLEILALIADPEPLEIIVQPAEEDESVTYVPLGGEFKLECHATGLPPPTYLWHHYNTSLDDQTGPILYIKEFTDDDVGEYYCIVSHTINDEICSTLSYTIIADIMPEAPVLLDDLPTQITKPQDDCVVLTVSANGRPPPIYQWVINNRILDHEISNTLRIKNVQFSDEGVYRCVVSNIVGEVSSVPCTLTVYSPPHDDNTNKASAKLALLIANAEYDNLSNLQTPSNDVVTLAHTLMQLGFHVITLHNLTLIEMRNAFIWFCQLLPPNAYAFIYFAGHGFELGNKFMMPVDCPGPDSYLRADCFCDQELIKYAMKASPQLLIILLDMCLKIPSAENQNIRNEKTPMFEYEHGNCNLVLGTATASHLSAYEQSTSNNGLYVKYLSQHLFEDDTVTSVLQRTQEDFQRHEETKLQKPAIYMDSAHNFKLTDPVQSNKEFDEEISALVNFSTQIELYFSRVRLQIDVSLQPHRGCFLNSVDLIFSSAIDEWKPNADINSEDLNRYSWSRDEENLVLTLHNIQKAKSCICVTIRLNKELENGELELIDYCPIELACPLISQALWFKRTALE